MPEEEMISEEGDQDDMPSWYRWMEKFEAENSSRAPRRWPYSEIRIPGRNVTLYLCSCEYRLLMQYHR